VLPDYPKLKKDLASQLTRFLQDRTRAYLGPLAEIRRLRAFEGDAFSIVRAGEEEEPHEFDDVESIVTISNDELPTMTLESLLAKLDEAAEGIARQIAQGIYRTIFEATERAGAVLDTGGQQVSAQTILDALSGMQIDFNDDGTARFPQIHIHPDLSEALRIAMEQLDSNPSLRREFRRLLERKREEWRVREASRKLVG
jgi:hypothetical protein